MSQTTCVSSSKELVLDRTSPNEACHVVDHVLLGTSDLDCGIAWLEERVGLRAQVGGVHPGVGTRNALLSLGNRQYLEVIAPDPAQANLNFPIDLRSLEKPRLVTWAVRTPDLLAVERDARAAGFDQILFRDGARTTLDGINLAWKTLRVGNNFGEAEVEPLPFFIEWSPESAHPAETSPKGCELASVTFEHLDASTFGEALSRLGLKADVRQGPDVRVLVSVRSPKGTIQL